MDSSQNSETEVPEWARTPSPQASVEAPEWAKVSPQRNMPLKEDPPLTAKDLGRGEGPGDVINKAAIATAEAGASLVSQTFLAPLAGLAGLSVGAVGGDAAGAVEKVNSLAYEPRSQWGKNVVEAINLPFKLLAEGGEIAGDKVMNVTNSALAASTISTAVQALPLVLGGLKAAKARQVAQAKLAAGRTLPEAVTDGMREVGGSVEDVAKAREYVEKENEVRLATLAEKDTLSGNEGREWLARKEAEAPSFETKDGREVKFRHTQDEEGNSGIEAIDNTGQRVGKLDYSTKEDAEGVRLNPSVEVHKDWRRQGIASRMYDMAEERGGKIPPSDVQGEFRSEAGKAFRAARDQKPTLPGQKVAALTQKSPQPETSSKAIAAAAKSADPDFFGNMKLTSDNLSDALFRLETAAQDDQLGALEALKKTPSTYKKVAEDIYHSYEDSSHPLSPQAAITKERMVEPLMKENADLFSKLRKIDPLLMEEEGYVARRAKGKSSIFEALERMTPGGSRLSSSAPSLKSRVYFKAVSDDGETRMVSVKNGNVTGWREGETFDMGKSPGKPTAGNEFEQDGKKWKLQNATTKEIERHTPTRYHKDALGTAIDSNLRLKAAWRNVQFLEGLKKNPDFQMFATETESGIPKGWKTIPELPTFRGWAFEPHIAEVLQDFVKDSGLSALDKVAGASRLMTGSLFWNPFPHIMNEFQHWVDAKGVTGWVNPLRYPKVLKTSFQAIKEVTSQGPLYRKMLREGASLQYPRKLLENFTEKVMTSLGNDPKMESIAKGFGYASTKEMLDRAWRGTAGQVYDWSGKTMWKAKDILTMQAFIEKGASLKSSSTDLHAIIKDVEKHIPNYRVRSRVLMDNEGGRLFSQMLQSPALAAFGRYDYARLRSYGEMVKDIASKDHSLRDRMKAIDQMAMVGISSFIIYPMIADKIAQWLTGDSNASVIRFGSTTIPTLIYSWMQGEKSMSQVFQGMFPMAPATKEALQLTFGRNLYTGKETKDWKEAAEQAAGQFSPVQTATQMYEGKKTLKQFGAEAVGIRLPSDEQIKAANKRRIAALRQKLNEELKKGL